MKQKVYQIMSDWLNYPTEKVKLKSGENSELIKENYPEIEPLINDFVNFYQNSSIDRLEEIYTSTFDLNPTCYPYVGYQLFGDGYQRGEFLVKLKAKYVETGFNSDSKELADHLTIILEFLATLNSSEILGQELIIDGLIPTLEKIKEGFTDSNNYGQLLEGLLLIIKQEIPQETLKC